MIQVLLRVVAWLAVFGIGYLYFGPEVFNPSANSDQQASKPTLYLPPIKSQRLLELEQQFQNNALSDKEAGEYLGLVRQRQSQFWSGKDISIEQVLADLKTQRKQHLIKTLQERGVSRDEMVIFLTVVERDHGHLLEDRE